MHTDAPIQSRTKFDFLRYANCWESAEVLSAALLPAPGKRILSIASGGDNALALAAQGAEVVAADLNPVQLACMELKMAAIRQLDYPEVLAFLGITPESRRGAIYRQLRSDLTEPSRAYWDQHAREIKRGFIHTGKFEMFFHFFRTVILPLIHSRRQAQEFLKPKNEAQRIAFYTQTWDNFRWRWLCRMVLSRISLGRLGRDPEFFRYVEGTVSDQIFTRVTYALTTLETHTNPYLTYILTGNYLPALPFYLHPERFSELRAGLERIVLFLGPIGDAAQAHGQKGFDGYNLSDIFEYLSVPEGEALYRHLLTTANPHARVAYWNMLAPRMLSTAFPKQVVYLEDLSQRLHAQDQAFFYSRFLVEEVQ